MDWERLISEAMNRSVKCKVEKATNSLKIYMRVFLVRHGETEHNVDDSITGQLDVSLNKTGREQASKLAERLSKIDFAEAYSSDLERTYETVKIISEKHDLRPQRFKEFREMDFGVYEGQHKSEFRKDIDSSEGDKHFFVAEGGESSHEAGERFLDKLDELKERHRNDTVLVGGHSVVLKSVLMNILDLSGGYYRKLNLGNTSITELIYDDDIGWQIIRVNDTAHLEQD